MLTKLRTGYPVAFLTRQNLLRVISDHTPDKSKVFTSKRVLTIENTAEGVTAICEDGTSYHGDILVGADGVHSMVRSSMQQHLESVAPGSTKKDQTALSAEYNCIFGFSDPVKGHVVPGDSHRSYAKEHSTLVFIGGDKRIYWFLFSKLDKRYYGKDIPRWIKTDMEKWVKPFFNIHMTDTIKFDEVWETRTFTNMVCIEESQFKNWSSGRMVCVGDSVHKVISH